MLTPTSFLIPNPLKVNSQNVVHVGMHVLMYYIIRIKKFINKISKHFNIKSQKMDNIIQ